MSLIAIDPRAKLVYASIYILGLQRIFGKENVVFKSEPFKELKQNNGLDDFDHYFSFFCYKSKKRYVVDFRDKNTYNTKALDWCNVYAKVNLRKEVEEFKNFDKFDKKKIIGVGPNFGIKIYSDYKIFQLLLTNYLKSKLFLSIPVGFQMFSSGYKWMVKRQTLDNYEISNSRDNFIFHLSSFYQNQNYGEKTNELRAEFIRSCKNINGILFEGGLLSRPTNELFHEYKDVIVNQYIPNPEYIKKSKESVLAFSTPAAWGCHGWKLGEYFAMGKAIISSPFYNDLPEGIIHGENIHIVDDVNQVKESVKKIINDTYYRKKLQMGARQYYNDFLKPESSIKRIIDHE